MIATIRHAPIRFALFLAASMAVCHSADAAIAGRIQFVAGDVRVLDAAGKARAATKGQEVNEGETITTAANGSAQLRMIDGGIVALRPDTRLKVETYTFNGKEDGSENAVFSLLKGGLRAITGVIGKRNKERYSLRTPTATIGIRGTDHEPMVVLPPPPGEVAVIPPGTYDKVNVGATALTTQAGTALIAPNQVGFAAAPDRPPVILPKMPDFYQAASASQAKQEKKEEKQQAKEAVRDALAAGKDADDVKAAVKDRLQERIALAELKLTGVDEGGNTVDLTGGNGTKRRGVAISDGWQDHKDTRLFDPSRFDLSALFRGSVDGDMQVPDRVIGGAKGLTEFLGRARGYTPAGATTPQPMGDNIDATIKIGTAVNRDVGSVTIDSYTMAWGRWEGGVIDIYSIDGTSKLGTVDNTNRSTHWLATSPFDRSAFVLPKSGTASYTVAGATTPTDMKGNTGTLDKMTLNADFSAAKINASVEVSFNSPTNTSHWIMNADNIPLSSEDDGFQSDSSLNGVNGITHSVTCTGPSCGQKAIGNVDAHLFSHANGAVVSYGMMTGNSQTSPASPNQVFAPTNIVSGIVVMKR